MKLVIRSGLLVLTLAAGGLVAQNPAIQRTILQWQDTSVPGREVVIARVKIRPGGAAGPHTHPGEEISYILDGEAEILVDGKPPLRVKSGDSFVIPAGARHDARNTGSQSCSLVAIYLIEKGKPLAAPAP